MILNPLTGLPSSGLPASARPVPGVPPCEGQALSRLRCTSFRPDPLHLRNCLVGARHQGKAPFSARPACSRLDRVGPGPRFGRILAIGCNYSPFPHLLPATTHSVA